MCTSIVQGSQVCCIHSSICTYCVIARSLTMAKKSMKKRRTGAANKTRQIANSKAMSSAAQASDMTELASHYAESAQKHIASRAKNFKKKRAMFNRVVKAGAQANTKPKPKSSSSTAKIECHSIAKLEKTHCGLTKFNPNIIEDPEI